MLLVYCIVIGASVLSGRIAPDRVWIPIALGCLVPLGAYAFGFATTSPDRDWGLLLSALGWACVALALLVQNAAANNARAEAAPGEFLVPQGTPAGVYFFAFLAFAFLLAGAVLGLQNWTNSNERS